MSAEKPPLACMGWWVGVSCGTMVWWYMVGVSRGIGWMVLFFAGTSDNPGQVGILAERSKPPRFHPQQFALTSMHRLVEFPGIFCQNYLRKSTGQQDLCRWTKRPKRHSRQTWKYCEKVWKLVILVFRQINPNYVVINDPHWQLVLEDNMWIMIHSTDGSSCSSTNRRPSWDASRPIRELAADTRMEDACSASQMSPGSLASTKD